MNIKKGGGSEKAIIIVIFVVACLIIGGGIGLHFLLKCTEVAKNCKNDDECCETLECKNNKCTPLSSPNSGPKSNSGPNSGPKSNSKPNSGPKSNSKPKPPAHEPYCSGRVRFGGECDDHTKEGKDLCNKAYQSKDQRKCYWDSGITSLTDSCEPMKKDGVPYGSGNKLCEPGYCKGRGRHNGKCNDHNNAGKKKCDNAYQTIDNALCKWDVGTLWDSCEKDPNGKYCDFK